MNLKEKKIKPGNIIILIITLICLTVLCFIICLGIGGHFINPMKFFSENDIRANILRLRFTRLLTAFSVGGALATAGVAYQAVMRNPLAEPYILGISGGASIGAATAIASGLAALSMFAIPLSAFAGALFILIAVLLIARGGGIEYSTNIMLSGIIAGSVCSSILMFMISVMGLETLHSVTWWMLGGLQAGDNIILYTAICVNIISLMVLIYLGRDTDVLCLGEETAYYHGVSPRKTMLIILGTASILTAISVSLAGIIGFVGLIVPHIIRRIFITSHRFLFPLAFLGGGLFLMICDTFARSIMYPKEIPVGVITASLGGPFFIWLLNIRNSGRGR